MGRAHRRQGAAAPGRHGKRELPTGPVEVFIREIEVLGPAAELPMPVFGEQDYPEDIRLKYRFLDLRREISPQHHDARPRHRLDPPPHEGGWFFEFQTPILTASSPEGARDYLVPSRLHPGKFYALPQAPQQFKQLIMMAGFDRYFQIAPCFRDEDARADRSPGEFYQLDIEMSFVTQEDVFDAVEPVMRGVFEEFGGGKPVTPKFPKIPFAEAMRKYGTDKPDLRNPIEMQDVTEDFRGSGFKVFANICQRPEGRGLGDPGQGRRQPRLLRPHELMGARRGPAGPRLHLLARRRGGRRRPVAKNIGPERTEPIADQLGLGVGDACFFVAGKPEAFAKFAGPARTQVGEELNLIDKDRFEFCWIVDFPMYEWNEEEKKIDFSHNPFSMPQRRSRNFCARCRRTSTISSASNLPVRHRLQRHRAVFRRDPQPSPRHHAEGLRDRRLSARSVLEAKFGGMLNALSLRRAAAWRHRARHRPHRHAAVRRGKPARGHAVPDEPEGRRPDDGRASEVTPSSCAS